MKANKGKGKRKPFKITQRRDMVILPNSLTEAAEESNIRRRMQSRGYGSFEINRYINKVQDLRRPKKPMEDLKRNLLSHLA